MNELGLMPGMAVRSADGQRLGRVKHCRDDGTFEVGRRLFSPHECVFRVSDVALVQGDYVVLKENATAFVEDAAAEDADPIIPHAIQLRENGWSEARLREPSPDGSELKLPLYEEEVHVERKQVDAGELRIHKTVVSEPYRVSVPVTIEVLRVERIPAHYASEPASLERAFIEETIVVPIRQQQVELVKSPVLREELLVARDLANESVELKTEVNREEVHFAGNGEHATH